jgi:hypothetical protein
VHAVFERFGDTWCVRDLGSRNGTFVNGDRVIGERALHAGDEILLGRLLPAVPRPGPGEGDGRDRAAAAAHAAGARRARGPVPAAPDRRRVHRAGVDPRDRGGARRLRGRGEAAPVAPVRQVRRGRARRAETRAARKRGGRPRSGQAGRPATRARPCTARPGCGMRRPASATATSWSRARGRPRPRRRFSSSGCATRSAPTAGCSPSRERTVARCSGTSIRSSGAGVRARSRPEEWKLYLPAGKPYRATCPEWPVGRAAS